MRLQNILVAGPIGLCVSALLACSATAKPTDVLIWRAGDDSYTTTWYSVDGDTVKTLGTREEAVTSDGTTLWALRIDKTDVELLPCEALEEENVASEGLYAWPSLQAVALNGKGSHWIVPQPDATFIGEIWQEEILLVGGANDVVMISHSSSGFGCGAHGYADSSLIAWKLGPKGAAFKGPVLAHPKQTAKAPTQTLIKRAKEEECFEGDLSVSDIYFDGLKLASSPKAGGAISATAAYVHPSGADWNFACTLEELVTLDAQQLAPPLRPSAAVKAVLKTLGAVKPVGYSVVGLSGPTRTAALRAFKANAAPTKPAAKRAEREAKPTIDKGRKLTKAKKYDDAIRAFDTAIRADPTAAKAWSGRGFAKLQAGKLDAAARDFDHALSLDADDKYHGAIWYNLGLIAEKKGEIKKARRAYKKSVALRPNSAVDKALKRLK